MKLSINIDIDSCGECPECETYSGSVGKSEWFCKKEVWDNQYGVEGDGAFMDCDESIHPNCPYVVKA